MIVDINRFRELSRRTQAGLAAVVLAFSAVAPLVFAGSAGAAPALLNRSLTSTSAVPGSTTQLEWTFDTPNVASNADHITIEFCDQPLTACTTTNTPTIADPPTATLSGPWASATVATTTLEDGTNSQSDNMILIDKTTADAAGNLSGLTITLDSTDVTNNAAVNKTYYTRLKIYSDAGTTLVYEGVFAQSTSQTLTVNARVQERLDFCVGATTVNDATTDVGDCLTISGTSVDIGNVENNNVNVSPVTAVNGGSETNGLAFIRTNAVNGASIAYRALDENGSGTLKVPGSECSDGVLPPVAISTVSTDQCFNTSGTQGVFAAGTERFGMTVAGVNCQATNAYNCAFASGNYNMLRAAEYDGSGANTFTTDADQITTTTSGYAWDANPANTTAIASSAGTLPSTGFRVVDNESLILKFAATAAVTTPTGAYSVQADFIATTTF